MSQPNNHPEPSDDYTRVLIVDDNPAIVKGLAIRLFDQGYDCLTALNGHEAMMHMTEPGVDALITDLDMPGVDGFALINLATSFKPCRCVVITGSAHNAMRCYREFPGVPVMMKPLMVEHIIAVLQEPPLAGDASVTDAA